MSCPSSRRHVSLSTTISTLLPVLFFSGQLVFALSWRVCMLHMPRINGITLCFFLSFVQLHLWDYPLAAVSQPGSLKQAILGHIFYPFLMPWRGSRAMATQSLRGLLSSTVASVQQKDDPIALSCHVCRLVTAV